MRYINRFFYLLTRSSAVAERPRDALCHWSLSLVSLNISLSYSMSFEIMPMSRASVHVSPY